MQHLRRVSIVLLLGCSCTGLFAQRGGYPDFELVESIPLETVLDNPDIRNTSEVWLEMITGATRTLDIEQFYLSSRAQEPLQEIIGAIRGAASRGVSVRIIADDRMHKTYPQPLDSLATLNNVSVRIINFGPITGGVQHAKYFIVDGELMFLGSQNFDWRALNHIHELGFRIRNREAVSIYQDVFDMDWELAAGKRPHVTRQYRLPIRVAEAPGDTLLFSPTMSPRGFIPDSLLWDEAAIVSLIDAARTEISCQALTYSTSERGGGSYEVLDNALRRAARRGVHVCLTVSDWSLDPPAINALKSLARVENIHVKYTEIPAFSKGYISFARVEHCKYIVVDTSSAWLGSCNFEKGYFYSLRNLGVHILSRKIGLLLRTIFLKSWDGPYAHAVLPEGEYHARKHGEQ
jgi:phosphatidylserine/phosphatidylglycerophosphate/cardiolipin synthase-like enzyme